jgi:hypothetical protein
VTKLWAKWSEIQIPAEANNFLFSKISRMALGFTHSPIQWLLGFFAGGKVAGV